MVGFNPAEYLQSSHEIASDRPEPEFPLRMLPRFLVVEGENGGGNGTFAKPPFETSSPVILEYEVESGLYNPCWTSIRPAEASGRWKLQVIPTSGPPMALLLLVNLPIVWANLNWTGMQAADFTFQSPSYLNSIVHSVRVRPA